MNEFRGQVSGLFPMTGRWGNYNLNLDGHKVETTLMFCHKRCFLISTNRLDDAIKACKLTHDKASKARGEGKETRGV